MGADAGGNDARMGTAHDLAVVAGLFAELGASGRAAVLDAAARAFAAQQLRGRPDGDVEAWLAGLADATFPHGDDAAGLIACAADFEPSARRMIFDGPALDVVLCAADDEADRGASMLHTYSCIRSAIRHGMDEAPEPAAFLGIEVDRHDFKHPADDTDDGWQFDEAGWRAEVERQCAAKFARMVSRWRRAFFAALVGS